MILTMTDAINNDRLHTVDGLCSTSAIESHKKNSLPFQISPSFVFVFITLYKASLTIMIIINVNA